MSEGHESEHHEHSAHYGYCYTCQEWLTSFDPCHDHDHDAYTPWVVYR